MSARALDHSAYCTLGGCSPRTFFLYEPPLLLSVYPNAINYAKVIRPFRGSPTGTEYYGSQEHTAYRGTAMALELCVCFLLSYRFTFGQAFCVQGWHT